MGSDLPKTAKDAPDFDQEPIAGLGKSPMAPNELMLEAKKLQQKLETLLEEIRGLITKTRELTESLKVPQQPSRSENEPKSQ